MARTAIVDSATAQFFINVVTTTSSTTARRPRRGTATPCSARSSEGMDVVDKIRAVPTGNVGMFQDVPLQPVTITKATVVQE